MFKCSNVSYCLAVVLQNLYADLYIYIYIYILFHTTDDTDQTEHYQLSYLRRLKFSNCQAFQWNLAIKVVIGTRKIMPSAPEVQMAQRQGVLNVLSFRSVVMGVTWF